MGGTYFSLSAGPMISETANAVKKGNLSFWSKHLSTRQREKDLAVTLVQPAGRDEISDALLEIVDDIVQRTKSWKNDTLKVHCHKLAEYTEPPPHRRLTITVEKILKATGKSPERIKKLQLESELWNKLDAALA